MSKDRKPMNNAILQRISRIYAAIGSIEEDDPHKLKATVICTEKIKAVIQDFRGGFSDDELSNLAYSVIHNIANLRDHLRRWAFRTISPTARNQSRNALTHSG
jgi:hypothetical protein